MTIAEIHGKISQTGSNLTDRLEDMLTSDIFSTCKYIQPESLLLPLIASSKNLKGERLNLPNSRIVNIKYEFWPKLPNCEPDVLVTLEYKNEGLYKFLFEAKYLSGKSGTSLSEDEIEIASTPVDQVAREFFDLIQLYPEIPESNKFLIYLTAHYAKPTIELINSIGEINKVLQIDATTNIFWNSWRQITYLINQQEGLHPWEVDILNDIKILLQKKGLIHFIGFNINLLENKIESIYKTGRKYEYFEKVTGNVIEISEILYSRPLFKYTYNWQTNTSSIKENLYER